MASWSSYLGAYRSFDRNRTLSRAPLVPAPSTKRTYRRNIFGSTAVWTYAYMFACPNSTVNHISIWPYSANGLARPADDWDVLIVRDQHFSPWGAQLVSASYVVTGKPAFDSL